MSLRNLQDEWDMGRTYAHYYIEAAAVVANVHHGGQTAPILPTSERQARALTKLDDPEDQAEAWAEALE